MPNRDNDEFMRSVREFAHSYAASEHYHQSRIVQRDIELLYNIAFQYQEQRDVQVVLQEPVEKPKFFKKIEMTPMIIEILLAS